VGLKETSTAAAPPVIRVGVTNAASGAAEYQFQKRFRIGRTEECEVCVKDEYVSRAHVEVTFENGSWWARDLNSSNGVYVNGERVQQTPIARTTIRLGVGGPFISFDVVPPAPPPPPPPPPKAVVTPPPPSSFPPAKVNQPMSDTMVNRYVDHYFGQKFGDGPVGEHTMIVRQAFSKVQKKQKRKYGWMMAVLGALVLAAAGVALYYHEQASHQKALAENLFYQMKSLDVDIAGVEKLVLDSNSQQGMEQIRKYQSRRKEMEKSYDQFLTSLHIYSAKMTPQEKLILRVARIFGECEIAMPPGFVDEINTYIKKWQSSGRLKRDINTAKENGYTKTITDALLAQDLPPQFFYMALQESDFDPYISGPPTRKGIAKGMWQFIPETAVKYGLHIGPLAEFRRPDPGDDRHHYDLATKAAARYLKDLYSTDAEASGFLVMACYNWGEDYVLPLVRKLPPNPKDRNFWRLIAVDKDKIPEETYNYVFYIVSAAVIGEDPKLFGFDFENPLAQLESR
jgi:hypothetical protein